MKRNDVLGQVTYTSNIQRDPIRNAQNMARYHGEESSCNLDHTEGEVY